MTARTLLAEIDDGALRPRAVPDWLEVLKDITGDEQWTGAKLAERYRGEL